MNDESQAGNPVKAGSGEIALTIAAWTLIGQSYSGLEGLIVVKHGEAGDSSQRSSTPKAWLPPPLGTNAFERNQLASH
jgi:hypothetical protein